MTLSKRSTPVLILALCGASLPAGVPQGNSKVSLSLAHSVELPDVSGDMDHLAIDTAGQRLFLAAEDNGTIRVVDLKSGKVERTVKGFNTPHSILYLPESSELYVTDGSKAIQVLDSKTFQVKKTVGTTPGADSIGVDPKNHLLYAVTGGKDVSMTESKISAVNTQTGKLVSEMPIAAAHVEAMALETSGPRLFVNVTDKNYLAVVDRNAGKIIARWPVAEAKENAPIALDEPHHRIFVVCRAPGKLVVLDSATGKSIASFPTGSKADEVVFDAVHQRIYVASGEGKIFVYRELDPDRYEQLASIPSAPGAKTALLSPDATRLFVAVSPGEGKTGAKMLTYDVN